MPYEAHLFTLMLLLQHINTHTLYSLRGIVKNIYILALHEEQNQLVTMFIKCAYFTMKVWILLKM